MYGIPHYAHPTYVCGKRKIIFQISPSFIFLPSQTEVIVNTTGENLCLSSGAVSDAILKKAGRKMQEEIYKYRKPNTLVPNVLETGPYGLDCKRVFHTVCPVKSDDRNGEVTTESYQRNIFIEFEQFLCLSKKRTMKFIDSLKPTGIIHFNLS